MSFGILGVYSLAVSSTLVFSPIIVNIQSLSEIQVSQPHKTLFLLDLDDTVFDFPNMVGSKSWRSYIGQATKKIDNSRDWHDVLSYFLTKNYPVKTVEPMTKENLSKIYKKEVTSLVDLLLENGTM